MRYLPLTPDDRSAMLNRIGARDMDALFRDVPKAAIVGRSAFDLPGTQGELEVERHMSCLAAKTTAAGSLPFFCGAGAYRHHVPASVDHLIQRSEFLTSYTPYQPEIAQGTLQYLFEFQTQVALLTGMEVANASLYDGSTATAEAVLMAQRVTKRPKAILSGGLHPHYAETVETVAALSGQVVRAPVTPGAAEDLASMIDDQTACVVVQSPDVFGLIRNLKPIAEAAHAKGALLIAVVTEIVSLGLIEPPGVQGADIVAAEGQSIGNGINFGGPYVGLFATREKFIRQMPGRLTGETVDAAGKRGYVLTLSTREQHIRREKATSNICTNSGLCCLAFTIHLSLLGEEGFSRLARANHAKASSLADKLSAVKGVSLVTPSFFNEFTLRLPIPAAEIVDALVKKGVIAGVPVSRLLPHDPGLRDLLIVAATETNTDEDCDAFAKALAGGAVMTMNSQGRKTSLDSGAPGTIEKNEIATISGATISGDRGLDHDEALIFELGRPGMTGVDIPHVQISDTRLGGMRRRAPVGLPGLSEPEVVRHYVRLSRMNYAIDAGLYPLGSCTMKHNPRLNEKMARLPGFADAHPLAPQQTVQGALEVIAQLMNWLTKLTGMPAVAMSPKAGAHGELCGMLAIRAAIEARGETRNRVLVPESAHGTNPATAAFAGFTVDEVPATADGHVDVAALKAKLGPDVGAIMLTNPNTCGLFERDIIEIADAVHAAGAYFYCDGANFNAIAGRVRPGDLGVDAMHINLHKTFSTPHGGGGPGAGPVVLSAALAPFAPLPLMVHDVNGFRLIEDRDELPAGAKPFGRMCAFHGQMGMFQRALTYMLSHGADGIRQASEDAVLSANYILASLKDVMSAPFGEGPCMHEALFDDSFLEGTGVTTLDFAKAMIDEGYHPMTMYFPLVVHGAMLIEPTESEFKESVDRFIHVLRTMAEEARRGDTTRFAGAPRLAPRRRLDETAAARKPVLRWKPRDLPQAAE